MAANSNNFGFELYEKLLESEDPNENLLISPLSISMALGMTMNGADGSTYDGMQNTLGLDGMDETTINDSYANLLSYLPAADPNTTANVANSIWYRDGFSVQNEFVSTNSEHFDAEVSALDFGDPSSKDIINDWVNLKTNGMIESIVDEISAAHVMFIINALYFNAPWATSFDPEATTSMSFYKEDGSTVAADMMFGSDIPFGHFSNDQVTIVDLPYGNEQYHFTALMPGSGMSVAELAQSLDASTWQYWMSNLNYNHELLLHLPKFEFDYKVTLNSALATMGMNTAFSPMADFSRISLSAPMQISKVQHKTKIKVHEEGTEAAAVTSVEIVVTSAPPMVTLNNPFLIVIHEKETGAILFMGQLMDPTV